MIEEYCVQKSICIMLEKVVLISQMALMVIKVLLQIRR